MNLSLVNNDKSQAASTAWLSLFYKSHSNGNMSLNVSRETFSI